MRQNDIRKMTEEILAFRNEREWKRFHNPKDMALSLALEASELLEHFQWVQEDMLGKAVRNNREALADELIDCLYWVLLMAHDFRIELGAAFERKMAKNRLKYPVNLARGSSSKYNLLAKKARGGGEKARVKAVRRKNKA